MSDEPSAMWRLAAPISVLVFVAACYVKIPEVRTWVDTKFPAVKEKAAQLGFQPSANKPSAAPTAAPASQPDAAAQTETPQVAANPTPAPIDLRNLSPNHSEWPKVVYLRKAIPFPAVANGQVIGNVIAPAGAEVHLKDSQGGRLGLEFNGGGAWVTADDVALVRGR